MAGGGLRVLLAALLVLGAGGLRAGAQENPLGQVHTDTAPPAPKPGEDKRPVVDGNGTNAAALATSKGNPRIRVDVNMVLVPNDGDRPDEPAGDRARAGQFPGDRK